MKFIALLLILVSCQEKEYPVSFKIIKEIHVCDKSATCSVSFQDGSFNQYVSRPIKGAKVKCTSYPDIEFCELVKNGG